MQIEEKILRVLSRKEISSDYCQENRSIAGSELSLLRDQYPALSTIVKGKRIVDFGCGYGRESIALALEEGCYVYGIDTNQQTLQKVQEAAQKVY